MTSASPSDPTPSSRAFVVPPPRAADVVEVGEIVGALRRRWRTIAGAVLSAAAIGVALLVFAPRRYDGASTVLVRDRDGAGGSLLSRLGVPTDLAPAGMAAPLRSSIETELQILRSRSLLEAVSDSLGLQVRVVEPAGAAPWTLVQPRPYAGAFRKIRMRFTRDGGGFRVTGRGLDARVAPGRPLVTGAGVLALAPEPLPDVFEVQVLDREDAMERLGKRLGVDKVGGDVARLSFAAPDSLSAASVPNALVAHYLARRKTVDRGVNQHRAEFVSLQLDSVGAQLASAEAALRSYQERTGVLDPELVARLDLEGESKLREQVAANEVERAALDQMLAQVTSGTINDRQLAAYPTFLRSPAINEILAQLSRLDIQRTTLLERRTEADPEVQSLTTSIRQLEGQLRPIGVAYAGALRRQRAELSTLTARFDSSVAALPAAGQEFGRRTRDVRRLSQATLALQTQLLDAQLAAIGEGGDVRQIDHAFVPKRPTFPRPLPVMASALAAGALVGIAVVVVTLLFSPTVAAPSEAGRLLGVPAARLGRGTPLFFAAVAPRRDLAFAPLSTDADADAVARWLRAPDHPNGAHAVVTAGNTSAMVRAAGEDDGTRRVLAHASSARTLPALSEPGGLASVAPGLVTVLVARRGTKRSELLEAATALSASGADLVAVVLT